MCRGACRGPGGTPHAKYFLFKNVGAAHVPAITFQTSMNLTYMAYQGQWNQAQVSHSPEVYADFLGIFRQARLARPVAQPYHVKAIGLGRRLLLPAPAGHRRAGPGDADPRTRTRCVGATTPGGRTKIRVDQYAIYGDRGVWLSKKLRALWKARLRRLDHLLRQQPAGALDPAQPDRARPDPDAPVGGDGLAGATS